MKRSLKGASTGVWIAVIIIVAILATYGGYYTGLHQGILEAGTLPSRIEVGVLISNLSQSENLLRGVDLAAKVLNESGGIATRNVVLILERTYGDPTSAKESLASLADRGVNVFIGALSNLEVKELLPLLHENELILVLVSSEVYDNEVYQDDHVIKFLINRADVEARVMVDAALNIGKSAAIIAANDTYCNELAKFIRDYYTSQGGQILYDLRYNASNVAVTHELMNIKELKPAVVFLVGYLDDAQIVLRSAKGLNITARWVMPSSLSDRELLAEDLAPYLEGSYVVVERALVETSPKLQKFRELYYQTYNELPSKIAAYGFDALMLTTLSIAQAGRYDGSSIRAALNITSNYFDGVMGRKILDNAWNAIPDYVILEVVKTVEGTYDLKVASYWLPRV